MLVPRCPLRTEFRGAELVGIASLRRSWPPITLARSADYENLLRRRLGM